MRHLENESMPHKESQKIPAFQVLAPANRFSRLANLPDGHLGQSVCAAMSISALLAYTCEAERLSVVGKNSRPYGSVVLEYPLTYTEDHERRRIRTFAR